MRPVRHWTGKLALTLTLAVAALMLPSSRAHAQQGHGGGHAGRGGLRATTHHGHHPYGVGYGGTWGGYYPYGGYDSFYGGYYGYGVGDYYGFGVFNGNGPAFGGVTPYWGVSPVGPSTSYGFVNAIDFSR
jgi:hypothetical protein